MFEFVPKSKFLAQWMSRWLELKTSLGYDPSNSFAWQWMLRLKILAFMMSRYGEAALQPPEKDPAEPFLPTFIIHPASSRLVLSGRSIRNSLTRISELNKFKLRIDQI